MFATCGTVWELFCGEMFGLGRMCFVVFLNAFKGALSEDCFYFVEAFFELLRIVLRI